MTFSRLSTYFSRIEKISSRIEITKLLAELFSEISSGEIDKVLYLLQGRVCPLYVKMDFGLGEKLVLTAGSDSVGMSKEEFSKLVKKYGDLGTAIEHAKELNSQKKYNELTITEVFSKLTSITSENGMGSQERKLQIVSDLLGSVDPLSAKYIIRVPVNMLRLGFSDMTILDGFSWMLTGGKSLRKVIEKAYHVLPDIGLIGKLIKEKGIEGLSYIKPKLFVPILMMKAERLSSGEEIISKLGEGIVESKFDGFRLQAHIKKLKNSTEVRLFSRGLDDVTHMYPDIVEALSNEIDVGDAIVEGEAIGYNSKTGEFLPFQETVQRKRKYNIEEKIKEIPLKFILFELLYLNGVSFLNEPLTKRRESLTKITDDKFSNIILSPSQTIKTPVEIEEALFPEQAVGPALACWEEAVTPAEPVLEPVLEPVESQEWSDQSPRPA
ncbi:MAG: ATP-dependent DNA ligase [Candidatus Roizmanbacteria bacterium]